MEIFPLPPLVQTQVWLNSTAVGICNGNFSIATLGSDSGLAEFNRRVNSNGKFSIVTQAEIQVWLGSTRVGISHRHLRKSSIRPLPLLLAYAIALASTFFCEMSV